MAAVVQWIHHSRNGGFWLCIPTNAISKQLQMLQVYLHMYECKFVSWENAFTRALRGFFNSVHVCVCVCIRASVCVCVCVCVLACVFHALRWMLNDAVQVSLVLPCNISWIRSIFRSNSLLISERSATFQPNNCHQNHRSPVLLIQLEIKTSSPPESSQQSYSGMLVLFLIPPPSHSFNSSASQERVRSRLSYWSWNKLFVLSLL